MSAQDNRKRPPLGGAAPSFMKGEIAVTMPGAESTSSSNKKAKLLSNNGKNEQTSILHSMLDDDALRAILVRTCASDHNSLRQTCKRFGSILDSFAFRQERGLLGYAEVQGVFIRPAFEQYKEDYNSEMDEEERILSNQDTEFLEEYDDLGRKGEYGNHEMYSTNFKVLVDGQELKMEGVRIHLLPRRAPFFEMCDSLASDLQQLSVTCFSNRGKLRLPSLKEAAAVAANPIDKRPLLYISEFELPKEYRNLACPVGPILLQSLLSNALKDRWSIAMYNPYNSAQFTERDKSTSYEMADINHILRTKPLSEEQVQMKKDFDSRKDDLKMQDMRQFFRAGFHQVTDETVLEDEYDIVYALPSDISKPILTEAEALQIKIERPPKGPPPKTAEEEELFSLMKRKSRQRQDMARTIDEFKGPVRGHPMYRHHFLQIDEQLQQFRDFLQMNERTKLLLEEQRDTIVPRLDGVSTVGRHSALNQVYELLKADPRYTYPETTQQQFTVDAVFAPALKFHDDQIEALRGSISETEAFVADLEDKFPERVGRVVAEQEQNLREYDSAVRLALKEFLENANAPIEELILKSDAIHACTYHMAHIYVQYILDLLPSSEKKTKALNDPDDNGATPLMLAASSRSLSDSEEPKRIEMCKFLIEHGADKNATRRGLTALGAFRQARRGENDSALCFGWSRNPAECEAKDRLAAELESILTPVLGPTPADEAILIDDDDSDLENDWEDEEEDVFEGDELENEADWEEDGFEEDELENEAENEEVADG